MPKVAQLIAHHHSTGLLVDTNLLVLYLVGQTNRSRISNFKRTHCFAPEDYDLLEWLIARFSQLVSTPHILTEASNLTRLAGRELVELRSNFKMVAERMVELYEPSKLVVSDPCFIQLGLTDAAIARQRLLVLTVDLDLYLLLEQRGVDVINFNHIRTANWR